jgi:hypothetical protein
VLLRTDSTYDLYGAQLTAPPHGVVMSPRIDRVRIGRESPAARLAAQTPVGSSFLGWSRFPYFVDMGRHDSGGVFIGDARYARGSEETWAGVLVPLRTPPATP